jgi:NAD(P)-dependent dehydrogenase (short-subunit alcohol dehydrogenase family)
VVNHPVMARRRRREQLTGRIEAEPTRSHDAGCERVVSISTLNGRVSFPFTGIYSASKFATEAVADCLRVASGAVAAEWRDLPQDI